LKIWIINHFAYGPDQSAGTRHFEFAKELQKLGQCPLIISSSFYHKGRKEYRLKSREKYRRENLYGVLFQWIKTPPYINNPFKRMWNMIVFAWRVYLCSWKKENENPDVIIGSTPSLLSSFAGLLIARRYKTPFVLEVRDIWPDSLNDVGGISRSHPVFVLFKCLEKFLYKKSDLIITLLPNSFEHIVTNGGNRKKIVWIPNCVNLKEKPPLPSKSNRSPFTLTYFGAHGIYNGLDKLIEAASILKERGWDKSEICILLIGEGPSKNGLIKKSYELNVQELVHFKGAVPKKNLWAAIESTDSFLMIVKPMKSLEKGISPNKLWDYLSAARPVIFSTVNGDSLAIDSKAGLSVEPGNARALADGIEKLYKVDEKIRLKLGENGRKYAELYADLPKLAKKLDYLLKDIVQRQQN